MKFYLTVSAVFAFGTFVAIEMPRRRVLYVSDFHSGSVFLYKMERVVSISPLNLWQYLFVTIQLKC